MEMYKISQADGGKNGLALIINIKDFAGEPNKTRYGSEKDVENLEGLAEHLNLKVILVQNPTKVEFLKAILDFVEQLENNDADLSLVCIMSHGGEDNKIAAADNNYVNIEVDILDRFQNKFCKKMIGKPKVFLFQACRGGEKDAGVMVPTGSRSAVTDSSGIVTEQRNDSFEAYSTTPHHVSYRYTNGSPFITITCQVIKENSNKMHLQDMFLKIKSELDLEVIDIVEEEDDGTKVRHKRKVLMETTCRLAKHLYLRPHEDMEEISRDEGITELDAAKHREKKKKKKSNCILQ